jgi:hypothetical protein
LHGSIFVDESLADEAIAALNRKRISAYMGFVMPGKGTVKTAAFLQLAADPSRDEVLKAFEGWALRPKSERAEAYEEAIVAYLRCKRAV